MLHFMDAKAMLFVQNWEEAICTSHKKHKFRTHTKQELESFNRKHGECSRFKKFGKYF